MKNKENLPAYKPLTDEEKQAMMRSIGLAAAFISKFLLEKTGCHVDYKINGEEISHIEKLHALDITERIKLAVKEERYEDAANLKKLLDKVKQIENKIGE
jgi:hypothetical protein